MSTVAHTDTRTATHTYLVHTGGADAGGGVVGEEGEEGEEVADEEVADEEGEEVEGEEVEGEVGANGNQNATVCVSWRTRVRYAGS